MVIGKIAAHYSDDALKVGKRVRELVSEAKLDKTLKTVDFNELDLLISGAKSDKAIETVFDEYKKCLSFETAQKTLDCARLEAFLSRPKRKQPIRDLAKKAKAYISDKVKPEPKIHYASGEILAMQNAKPQKITVQSTPTQQYIDNMLGIKSIDEAEHLARYKDLKYAFNHPNIGKAKPVITESRLTADVVEEMHNTKYIDALKKAEVTGELTEATKQRRAEILEAFETCEPRPVPPKKTLKDKIKTWFNRKQPVAIMTADKSIARDYGVPGGHVPGWVALEKWAKRNGC
ncbi:hypothetical protein IJD34_07065 [bacterium]|nr:hypothetical protein [bacterium]